MTTIKVEIKPKEPRANIQTWLAESERDAVKKYAEEKGISMSHLVRILLHSILPEKVSL